LDLWGREIIREVDKGGELIDLLLYAESRLQDLREALYSLNGSGPRIDYAAAIVEADKFVDLEVPERRTLLHPWLTEAGIILIYGDRGVGKTFFGLGICDALTRREGFGPWSEGEEAVSCLYIDAELHAQDVKKRLVNHFLKGDRLGRLWVYSDHLSNLLGLPKANLFNEKWRSFIKAYSIENNVKVVVLDNIASLSPGVGENDKELWDPANQWAIELRFAGITVIFLHHANKEGGQRGTHSREDNLDISILLDRPSGYEIEEGAHFIAKFKKARVPQECAHLLSDAEFALELDEAGEWNWTWGAVKEKQIIVFLRLLNDGHKQKEIAEILGVKPPRASKLKQSAINLGYLTREGKITRSGMTAIL
jgi:hypothetical protein